MEIEKLIIEKLDKIGDDITDLKIVNAEQCKDIARNADDLNDHMEQTLLVRKEVKLLEKATNQRFNKLEAPRVFFSTGKKYFLVIGSLASAGWVLIRFWNEISALF